jgi:hypothetical protein
MTDPGRAREREDELAACASELERTRARLAEAELRLQAAREREQLTASSLRALAERARGELASCLRCGQSLCGSDLLVSGLDQPRGRRLALAGTERGRELIAALCPIRR